MSPDHLLLAALVGIAVALAGVFIGRRYAQPVIIATEQKAADVGASFLATLLDDSSDDRAIEEAQERKAARAAEGAKVLAKLQAKLQTPQTSPTSGDNRTFKLNVPMGAVTVPLSANLPPAE